MIETKGHYPYKQVMYFSGCKIIGKAEPHEKELLFKIISEDISKITNILSANEIYNILNNSSVYFIESVINAFSGTAGCSIGKKIFVGESFLDYMEDNNIEEFKNTHEYKTIVHECIHRIQSHYKLNKKDKYIGLVEGATESEALKINETKQGIMIAGLRYNFYSYAYTTGIAIIRQLEKIYGREVIEKFTYFKDKQVIELLERDYGKDYVNNLLGLLKRARTKEVDNKQVFSMQYSLMAKYFLKKMDNIETKEEAELFLKEFKGYMTSLIQFPDMTKYQELYDKFLNIFKEKFADFDIEKNKYEKPKNYPLETLEYRNFSVDDAIDFKIEGKYFLYVDEEEKKENFDNYNPDDFKKYKLIDGNNVFSLIIYPDNTCDLIGIYGSFDRPSKNIQGNGKYNTKTGKYELKCREMELELNCQFDPETRRLDFDTLLEEIKSTSLTFEEEQLELSKEDVYIRIQNNWNTEYALSSFSEKISKRLSGNRMFDYEEEIEEKTK